MNNNNQKKTIPILVCERKDAGSEIHQIWQTVYMTPAEAEQHRRQERERQPQELELKPIISY